jgi:hypothetical protein
MEVAPTLAAQTQMPAIIALLRDAIMVLVFFLDVSILMLVTSTL